MTSSPPLRPSLVFTAGLSVHSAHLLLETLPMSFTSLEKAVKAYHQHMPATAGQPLVLSSLPVGG